MKDFLITKAFLNGILAKIENRQVYRRLAIYKNSIDELLSRLRLLGTDILYIDDNKEYTVHTVDGEELIITFNENITTILDSGVFRYERKFESIEILDIDKYVSLHNLFLATHCKDITLWNKAERYKGTAEELAKLYQERREYSNAGAIKNNFRVADSDFFEPKGMFSGCNKLETVRLNGLDLSECTNTQIMFAGCTNLKEVHFENSNFSSIKSANSMFQNCEELTEIDISHLKNVEDIHMMFKKCSKLKRIDLTELCKVKVMHHDFYMCSSLEEVTIGEKRKTCGNKILSIHSAFTGCEKLRNLDRDNLNLAEGAAIDCAYTNCNNLDIQG